MFVRARLEEGATEPSPKEAAPPSGMSLVGCLATCSVDVSSYECNAAKHNAGTGDCDHYFLSTTEDMEDATAEVATLPGNYYVTKDYMGNKTTWHTFRTICHKLCYT